MSYDLKHYWCEARDCREGMRKFGRALTDAEWEQERADIHRECGAAMGDIPISSKDLTDDQFKKIKQWFRSWSKPTDFYSQWDAEFQNYIRWRWRADELLDRIEAVLIAKNRHAEAAPIIRGPARDGYLLAMFRRIGKLEPFKAVETASKEQMRDVFASLVYRFDQVARKGDGFGKQSPTRKGKPPLQRAFDEPLRDARPPQPRQPANLPACVKPVVLADLDHAEDPF